MKIDHSRYFTLDTLEDLKVMKVLEIKYPSLQKIDCLKTLRLIQKENKNFKKINLKIKNLLFLILNLLLYFFLLFS